MIIFEKLLIKNFLPFKHLDLTFTNGVSLVDGINDSSTSFSSNGVGKTALIEAIFWCFYGKTLRKITVSDIVCNQVGQDCAVRVLFSDEEEQHYTATRYREHKEFKNRFCFKANDLELWDDAATEAFKQIFPINENMFCSLIYFGKTDKYSPFHMMSDKEKKDVLVDLNPSIVKLRNICTDVRNLKATVDIDIVKTNEICNAQSSYIARLTQDVKRHNDSIIFFERRKESLMEDRQKEVEEMQAYAQELEVEIERDKNRINELDNDSATIEKQIEADDALHKEIYRKQAYLGKICEKIDQKEQVVSKLEKNKICPTCNRPWQDNEEEISRLTKALDNLKLEKKSVSDEVLKLTAKRDEIEKLKKQKKANDNQLINTIQLNNAREVKLLDLKQKINAVDFLTEVNTEISTAKALLENAEKKLKEAQVKLEKSNTLVEELKKKQLVLSAELELLDSNGLEALLLDKFLKQIEVKANAFSEIISNGEIEIFLGIEGGELYKKQGAITITSQNRNGSLTYAGNSNGEKTRVDICVLFALMQTLQENNGFWSSLMIVDEVFDGLDKNGVDSIMKLLKHLLFSKRTIWVISHNSELKGAFPDYNKILLKKENNISELVS